MTEQTTTGSCSNQADQKCQRCRPIYLVVVESHQHVLEHIHFVLRKEKLVGIDWSMLHFDAHPDLACPGPHVPALACFLPRHSFDAATSSWSGTATSHNEEGCQSITATKDNSQRGQKNLYELLDSTSSGIAEWILPLVLAANLRRVHWIKPSLPAALSLVNVPTPPPQLPLGIHRFCVGACEPTTDSNVDWNDGNHPSGGARKRVQSFLDLSTTAVVQVDWNHPYYMEDASCVEINDVDEPLTLPQSLTLHISELASPKRKQTQAANHLVRPQLENSSSSITHPEKSQLWGLDICLDYFAHRNPFVTDLEAIDPVYTKALMQAVYQSRFYSSHVMNVKAASPMESSTKDGKQEDDGKKQQRVDEERIIFQNYRRDLLEFRRFLVQVLLSTLASKQQLGQFDTRNGEKTSSGSKVLDTSIETGCSEYYMDSEEGQRIVRKLQWALQDSPCGSPHGECTTGEQIDVDGEALIAMTEQALPNLSMPHNPSPVSMQTISPILKQMQQELEHRYHGTGASADDSGPQISTSSQGTAPFIITIARSKDDGFTPSNVVEPLQEQLLGQLHGLYCRCSRSSFGLPVAPSDDTIAGTDRGEVGAAPVNVGRDCRFKMIFDYGPWEGSTFS